MLCVFLNVGEFKRIINHPHHHHHHYHHHHHRHHYHRHHHPRASRAAMRCEPYFLVKERNVLLCIFECWTFKIRHENALPTHRRRHHTYFQQQPQKNDRKNDQKYFDELNKK